MRVIYFILTYALMTMKSIKRMSTVDTFLMRTHFFGRKPLNDLYRKQRLSSKVIFHTIFFRSVPDGATKNKIPSGNFKGKARLNDNKLNHERKR